MFVLEFVECDSHMVNLFSEMIDAPTDFRNRLIHTTGDESDHSQK